MLAAWPALAVAAFAVDVVRAVAWRRPWTATPVLALHCVFLVAEIVGLGALFGAWIGAGFGPGRAARLVASTYDVQRAWTGARFVAVRALFGLRFEVEGEDAVDEGRCSCFFRHTSIRHRARGDGGEDHWDAGLAGAARGHPALRHGTRRVAQGSVA